jgi:glutamine synthetase
MAATLACGYLGMTQGLKPSAPTAGKRRARARRVAAQSGGRDPAAARQARLSDMLGPLFVQAFCEVKELEFATFSRVISSWEREHLMLLV